MIIRVFRVKIRKGRLADFKRLVQKQSIPWLNSSDGMLGCIPGEPLDEDKRNFIMVSMWRDLDSLKKFAGKDWANPVVTGDEAPLVENMSAEHFLRFDQEK
jgi:quinol monooxygenase YgiN